MTDWDRRKARIRMALDLMGGDLDCVEMDWWHGRPFVVPVSSLAPGTVIEVEGNPANYFPHGLSGAELVTGFNDKYRFIPAKYLP